MGNQQPSDLETSRRFNDQVMEPYPFEAGGKNPRAQSTASAVMIWSGLCGNSQNKGIKSPLGNTTYRTAKINEISGRYAEMPDLIFEVPGSRIGKQDIENKQCTSGWPDADPSQRAAAWAINDASQDGMAGYRLALERGVSREIARVCMPLSSYTRFYWTQDLSNCFNLLQQRLGHGAQHEITEYAKVLAEIVKHRCPVSYRAFSDHVLNAVRFSGPEAEMIRAFMAGHKLNLSESGMSRRKLKSLLDRLERIEIHREEVL